MESPYGSLLLGRQQTALRDFNGLYDPAATSDRYGILGIAPEFGARADNAVKYVGKFGALTGVLYEHPIGGAPFSDQTSCRDSASFGSEQMENIMNARIASTLAAGALAVAGASALSVSLSQAVNHRIDHSSPKLSPAKQNLVGIQLAGQDLTGVSATPGSSDQAMS